MTGNPSVFAKKNKLLGTNLCKRRGQNIGPLFFSSWQISENRSLWELLNTFYLMSRRIHHKPRVSPVHAAILSKNFPGLIILRNLAEKAYAISEANSTKYIIPWARHPNNWCAASSNDCLCLSGVCNIVNKNKLLFDCIYRIPWGFFNVWPSSLF